MEIELKLRLAPAAIDTLRADPLLANARHERKQLENIYFDTPEGELAQAGIALRLRRDGKHWLQTVKRGGQAQAGLHQREEIEFPVAGPALEWPELAATAFEASFKHLKDRLQPRYQTRFRRDVWRLHDASGAAVELCADLGEIIAGVEGQGKRKQALCEIELELLSGPVDGLFSLALLLAERHPLVLDNRSKGERGHQLATDAPPAAPFKSGPLALPKNADAAALVRLAIAHGLEHWQANEPGFINQTGGSDYNSEYLHQLRVALRRLRVACASMASAVGWQQAALAPMQDGLRQLGITLGQARDWDVFVAQTWPPLAAQLADAALRQRLQEALELQQASAHLKARTALQGRDCQRLLLQLGRCLAQPAEEAKAPWSLLTERIDRLAKQLEQDLPELDNLTAARLHRWRIATKKLRYMSEFIANNYAPEVMAPWLEWLRKAQSMLGAYNDRQMSQARIKRLCAQLSPPAEGLEQTLQAALKKQPMPALSLPPLPPPYWR